ncbi:MAG: phage virion morphogenesis protein [Acidobacteriota bacterium]
MSSFGLSVGVEGAREGAEDLQRLRQRLSRGDSLVKGLVDLLLRAYRANVESGGQRLAGVVAWPPLHPLTRRIRRRYGHGDGPMLVRDGTLARSIRVFREGTSEAEIGSDEPHAFVVHEGGPWRDPRSGRTRTLPARPFLLTADEDDEAMDELVSDHYLIFRV